MEARRKHISANIVTFYREMGKALKNRDEKVL